jgi:hypothetical protein
VVRICSPTIKIPELLVSIITFSLSVGSPPGVVEMPGVREGEWGPFKEILERRAKCPLYLMLVNMHDITHIHWTAGVTALQGSLVYMNLPVQVTY